MRLLLFGCGTAVAADKTDSKMRMKPVQRQRLPASPSRISAHRRVRVMREQMRGGHQHARRADAALRAAALQKCLLQRMENAVVCEPFDGLNVCAFGLQNRNEATIDQLAIHAHRAGAALAFAAAFLGAGEVQIFAQHIEQTLHGRDG